MLRPALPKLPIAVGPEPQGETVQGNAVAADTDRSRNRHRLKRRVRYSTLPNSVVNLGP
jgi:hypothetical protein